MADYNGIKTMTRNDIISELREGDTREVKYSKVGKEELERKLAARRGIEIPNQYKTADHLAVSRALRNERIRAKLTGDKRRIFEELDRTGEPRGLSLQARWLRKIDIADRLDEINHAENSHLNVRFTGFERLGIANTFILYGALFLFMIVLGSLWMKNPPVD